MPIDREPPILDAYSVWSQTRSAVTSVQYPSRIDYTIAITGLDGMTPAADHYRASCDPSDGSVRVSSISEEQVLKPPPVPHGVNLHLKLWLINLPVGHPPPYQDLLGEPLLEPTYNFGISYGNAVRTTLPPVQGESALRVIAVVSAQKPDYRVALIDTPMLDGVITYHLKLTPLRRPIVTRLRELWVGSDDFLPRRAGISGNFTLAPLVDVPWTVDFSVINGVPFVTRESTAATLYLEHHRVVREATIAFENIREASTSIYGRPLVEPAITDRTLVEPP